MQQQSLSPEQIQQAARAGVQVLNDPATRVPASLAMSGDLIILDSILKSLMTSQVILTNPPPVEISGAGNQDEEEKGSTDTES